MDERLRIILIIIISVSIFGLIIFVIVRNLLQRKLDQIIEQNKKEESDNLD